MAILSRDGYIRFLRLDSGLEIQIYGSVATVQVPSSKCETVNEIDSHQVLQGADAVRLAFNHLHIH